MHESFADQHLLAWPIKYGAGSVSVSRLDKIIQYIENQEDHHRKGPFDEEFIASLKKHNIELDKQFLWE